MAVTAAQLEVAVTATGVPQTEAAVKRVEKAGTQAQSRFASASFQLANSLETMARSGHLMGDSLKQVIFQASNVAFAFGTTGPIVAAVGVALVAILDLFGKAGEASDTFRAKLKNDYQQLSYIALADELRKAEERLRELQAKPVEYDAKTGLAKKSRDEAEILRLQQKIELLNREIGLRDHEQKLHPAEAYEEEIGALAKLQSAHALTNKDRERALRLIRAITDQLKEENLALGARADLEAARSRLLGIVGQGPVAVPSVPGASSGPRMAPIVGGDLTGEKLLGGPPPVIEIPVKPMTEGFATALAEQLAMEAERAQETVEYSFATFGSSVTASLAESLGEGIGTGFRGMGDILLKSLGSIFARMGQQLIAYGVTMMKLLPALSNPFTSGPAALIAGAALVALGAALGGIATGSGGASGGAAGASPISEITAEQRTVNVSLHDSAVQRASRVTPVQPIHFTVIGPDDPRAQRTIAEMVDNARARNL